MKTYSREEAEQLGYKVIEASAFEVGLVKGEQGVKTWWCQDFDRKLPDLGHPTILATVAIHEEFSEHFPAIRIADADTTSLASLAEHILTRCAEIRGNSSFPDPPVLEWLEGWKSPSEAAKMTAEYKNLVDIYTRAAETLGMQPDDNFHALDQLTEQLADKLWILLREIKFYISWSQSYLSEGRVQSLRQTIAEVEAVVKYSGPGRFFSNTTPETPSPG